MITEKDLRHLAGRVRNCLSSLEERDTAGWRISDPSVMAKAMPAYQLKLLTKLNGFLDAAVSRTTPSDRAILSLPQAASERPAGTVLLNGLQRFVQNVKDKFSSLRKAYQEETAVDSRTEGDNDSAMIFEKLKQVLRENWDFVKGKFLCYTANPRDDTTLLLCEIACLLAREASAQGQPCSPFGFLMPGVESLSFHDEYLDLNPLTAGALQGILCSHILSDDGRSLIPVTVLAKSIREIHSSTRVYISFDKLPNPYYNYYNRDGQGSYVTPAELQRLKNHSTATAAIFDLKDEYEAVIQNMEHFFTKECTGNLLEALNVLADILYQSGASGDGAHGEATEIAAQAICSFIGYYNRLSIWQQLSLPTSRVNASKFVQ